MRILFLLLALVVSASAKVIVYKGSARSALPDTISSYGTLPHIYLVVDLATKQAFSLLYYTVNGSKGSTTFLPFDNTHYVSRFVSATRTVGTFSYALDASSGSDIGVNMLYLRGNEKPLLLSNEVGAPTANYPRTMSGFVRVAQLVNIPSIYELNLTLGFDPVHTQIGNNAVENGQDVVLSIRNELTQKGY